MTWVRPGLLLLLTLWLWGSIVVEWVLSLWDDPNYSFGLIIFPAAAWFAWQRRDEISGYPAKTSYLGLAIVLAAIGVLFAGTLGSELFLSRFSFVLFLAGATGFLYGGKQAKLLILPFGLLLMTIPLPEVVFNQVAFPLQLLASHLAAGALDLLGVPVLQEGNILTLPSITMGVAEACSGIRSIFSLMALSIIYVQLSEPKTFVRVALVLTAIPIAVLVNCARVMGTGLLAEHFSARAADSFFHGFYGWLMFLAALVLLVLAHQLYSGTARILERRFA